MVEKKEVIEMMMQSREGRREDDHKFSNKNDDVDITYSIWCLTLNLSFILFCTTHAPIYNFTSLYYFPTKGHI